MIDTINDNRACHIITIEDPIEFVHRSKNSLINQRELGHDTWSFTAACAPPCAKTRRNPGG